MSALNLSAKLDRTDSSTPWGFRMYGGVDFGVPLNIQKVSLPTTITVILYIDK